MTTLLSLGLEVLEPFRVNLLLFESLESSSVETLCILVSNGSEDVVERVEGFADGYEDRGIICGRGEVKSRVNDLYLDSLLSLSAPLPHAAAT